MRAIIAELINFKLADSLLGIQAQSSFDDGYQLLDHCVFVGESPNLGVPSVAKLEDGSEVQWHRSLPNEKKPWKEVVGVENKMLSPLHIRNTKFINYRCI